MITLMEFGKRLNKFFFPVGMQVLFFLSNIPRHREDLPALHYKENVIHMYRNEPAVLGVWSGGGDRFVRIQPSQAAFTTDVVYDGHIGSVDRPPAAAGAAGIAREAFVEIRPRGEIGDIHTYNLTVSNYDGSSEVVYPLNVTLVESRSARLASLAVSPGRLDPEFSMDRLDYRIRIPPPLGWADEDEARRAGNNSWSSSFLNLDFATLNDRDASCSVDGGKTWTEGSGKFRINMLDVDIHQSMLDHTPLILQCRSADGTNIAKYPLTLIPQFGGDTLLTDIQVLGGDLAEQFDPNKHGLYRADLIKGAAKDGTDRELGWTRIAVRRNDPRARVTIDGHECRHAPDSTYFTKDQLVSNWIKVPRGERRVVRIVVSTPQNPVPEIYEVAVTRETSRRWWSTASGLKHSNWFGWLSNIAAGRNAASVLNNNKVVGLLSMFGHHAGTNEIYTDFSEPFHAWNAELGEPCKTHGRANSWIKVKSPSGGLLNCGVPAFEDTYSDDPLLEELKSTLYMFKPLTDRNVTDVAARKDANGEWSMSTTSTTTAVTTTTTVRKTSTTATTDTTTTTPPTTTPKPTTTVLETSGDASASRRRLIAVDPMTRDAFQSALDSRLRVQENFYFYVSTLVYTSLIVLTIIGAYSAIYTIVLRDPATGQLRCDYPAILHPGRFVIFVLDFCYIGFVAGAFGVLFTSRHVVGSIELAPFNVYAITISKPMLNAISMIVLMSSIAYVVTGSLALAGIADKVGYSAQFCTYHDMAMTHGRAIYVPKWVRNVPILRRLLAVNIDAVVPVKASQIPGSQAVGFTQVRDGRGSGDSYYQSLYVAGDKYVCEDGPEMRDAKSVQVGINDFLYNDQSTNYDGRNHLIYGKYSEAKFGETKFSLRNPYGYKVNVQSDLQIQHLTSLMQLIDDLRFWLPQKNCYFPLSDGVKNLLSNGPSTGGDASSTSNDWLNAGLYYDWSINRSLLFFVLGAAEFFGQRMSSPRLALYCITVFALGSGILRLPSALYSGSAKYQRDVRLQARYEREEVRPAIVKSQQADKIWPFNEPGFMERFKGIERRKRGGRFSLLGRLIDGTAGASKTSEDGTQLSEAVYRLSEVAFSPCGADLTLAVLGGCLQLSNIDRRSDLLATTMGAAAIIMAIATLACSNYRSLTTLYRVAEESADSIMQKTTEFGIHVADMFRSSSSVADVISYYARQVGKTLSGDPTANYSFPTQPIAVRKFPVKSVAVISNELGLQFPGEVVNPDMYDLATVPDPKRLRLYKTLIVHGGLGASRSQIYSSVPIQVPFSKLLHDDGAPCLNPDADFGRAIATIQVVNHTIRANVAGLPALESDEHDSFLTLYAHPKLLPEPGKVLLRKDGHTYSVRYYANEQKLVVRGPSIAADKVYSLRTGKSGLPAGASYVDGKSPDRAISAPSSEDGPVGRAASALALCDLPGTLRVQIPPHTQPWLYASILVQPTAATVARFSTSETIEIVPSDIKVHYDQDCGEMFLRHELLRCGAEYKVEWVIAPASPMPLDVTARAQDNGSVVFDLGHLPDEAQIDLNSWLVLKDTTTGAIIDIDPTQTDAYQFFFPENRQGLLPNLANHLTSFGQMIKGGDRESETMEEPIPCTVVQCVNPLQKIYRVDPNFAEGRRILNARLQEFRAKQRAVEEPTDALKRDGSHPLAQLWPSLLKNHEYVKFWSERGVNITDAYGDIMDPLNDAAHVDMYQSQLREVALGEQDLRALLSGVLDEKLRKIQQQLDAVDVWDRAYNDPVLHTSQLQTDIGEWAAQTSASASNVLESQKALYASRVDGFFYPCNIPDALISRRPNLSAQFRLWSSILQSWLFVEEGVDVSNPEMRVRIGAIVRDMMQSLKFVIHGNELASRNQYKSVLHYVIGSHALRGIDTRWKPDSLKAHTALVRIWTEDESKADAADFTKYPEWLPCLLRLTPQALQILLPNGDDLVRPASEDASFPWQKSTGLYVPLNAFHKFEIIDDSRATTPQEESNVLLNFMTTRLVCRKNQRDNIPDSYAQRVEDDNIGNEICFTDTTGQRRMKYRMMLGHTVSVSEARNYPQDEVDPALSSTEHGVNVFPLSFRMSPAFADQWRRAIKMSHLDEPHNFTFTVREPQSEDSPKAAAAEPSVTTDPYVSDDTVSEAPQYIPPPPPPPAPPTPESIPAPEPLPRPEESESDASATIDSNPEGISLYEGPLEIGRFDGHAIMRDEGGRAIYDGNLSGSYREGRGKLCFTDPNGAQWLYDGEFADDETCGNCVITLADTTAVANVTERYTLINYTGTVAPPGRDSQRQLLTREEMNALISNNRSKRAAVFSSKQSSLPNQQKVRDLIMSVYVRNESYGQRITADRFLVSDVVIDKYLLEAAQIGNCPLSRFVTTFLPYQCVWQDATTLQRASPTGEWRFVDGSIFRGALQGGKPDGEGIYNHWPTSTLYEGTMRNGVPDGEGVLVTGGRQNRAIYTGQLIQGAREGKGTLNTYEGQATINGIWASDRLDTGAMVVEIAPALMKQLDVPFTRYEGYIKDGVPEGQATVTYENGQIFRGIVANGIRQGRGELRNETGELLIDGNFNNNVPEGFVKFARYPDDYVYKGEMSKGQRQGMGQLVELGTDMVLYEGTWANDVPHGRGIYRAPDGEYEGEFRNGKRNGKGRFVFKDRPLANGKQRVYEGDWSNDVPDGVGKYINDDGLECVYKLNKGVIVEESIKAYKPACGKGPQVSVKPTVLGSNFKPYAEKDVIWKKSKHASIGNVLQAITQAAPTWSQTAGRSSTFIDPTRVVPLERISSE